MDKKTKFFFGFYGVVLLGVGQWINTGGWWQAVLSIIGVWMLAVSTQKEEKD